MPRPVLEVADILRRHGDVYRERNASHLSRDQLKVMGAVHSCRTAALGGPCRTLRRLWSQQDRL